MIGGWIVTSVTVNRSKGLYCWKQIIKSQRLREGLLDRWDKAGGFGLRIFSFKCSCCGSGRLPVVLGCFAAGCLLCDDRGILGRNVEPGIRNLVSVAGIGSSYRMMMNSSVWTRTSPTWARLRSGAKIPEQLQNICQFQVISVTSSFLTAGTDNVVSMWTENDMNWSVCSSSFVSYLAAIIATFTIQAMICPPNVFTWRQTSEQKLLIDQSSSSQDHRSAIQLLTGRLTDCPAGLVTMQTVQLFNLYNILCTFSW